MSGEDRWLGVLEEKVRDAATLIRRLREENQRMAERLEELEQQGADRWQEERSEIRTRVEALANGLEELLEE
ncbi:MAG: hypothetical protein AAF604_18900 [Acidobacteriota bacterium]